MPGISGNAWFRELPVTYKMHLIKRFSSFQQKPWLRVNHNDWALNMKYIDRRLTINKFLGFYANTWHFLQGSSSLQKPWLRVCNWPATNIFYKLIYNVTVYDQFFLLWSCGHDVPVYNLPLYELTSSNLYLLLDAFTKQLSTIIDICFKKCFMPK